jgi:hypothetical protein
VSPDVIICRSARTLDRGTRDKLALFCQVPSENVLTVHDVSNIYHVPLLLHAQGAAAIVSARLKLPLPQPPASALGAWSALADTVDSVRREVRIALVGKYTGLQDSYLSVIKALQVREPCPPHAGVGVRACWCWPGSCFGRCYRILRATTLRVPLSAWARAWAQFCRGTSNGISAVNARPPPPV